MQVFTVTGMTCGHCVRAVTDAVHTVDPAAQVEVDLPTGRVAVESGADATRLAQAIVAEGYEATPAA